MNSIGKAATVVAVAVLAVISITACTTQSPPEVQPVQTQAEVAQTPTTAASEVAPSSVAESGFHVSVDKYQDNDNGANATSDFGIWQRAGAVAVWIRDTRTNEVRTWVADGYTVSPAIEKALTAGDLTEGFFDMPNWNAWKDAPEGGTLRDAATSGLTPAWQVFFIVPTGEPITSTYIAAR